MTQYMFFISGNVNFGAVVATYPKLVSHQLFP